MYLNKEVYNGYKAFFASNNSDFVNVIKEIVGLINNKEGRKFDYLDFLDILEKYGFYREELKNEDTFIFYLNSLNSYILEITAKKEITTLECATIKRFLGRLTKWTNENHNPKPNLKFTVENERFGLSDGRMVSDERKRELYNELLQSIYPESYPIYLDYLRRDLFRENQDDKQTIR